MRRGGLLSQRGLTFVEMIATATILLILASAILPMATTMHKRNKELELRRTLRQIRTAIDEYKKATQQGATTPGGAVSPSGRPSIGTLEVKYGSEGYPETLEVLVEGKRQPGPSEIKVKFLRRIPIDPMTNSTEWGMRCYQDEPDSTSWCGKNVYDVYTKSEGRALDGTLYVEW